MKYFAKAVAKSLTIPGVGAFLKDEIGKKFDGDYDMLWETARDKEFPNQGRLRGLVASALRDMNSIASMDEIEEVPLLQVALPVGFEEWDGETPILVAYTPLTVNDVDVKEIYAYDSSGEEHVLDGQEPPDYPVMVVGINERVNLAGSLGKGLDMEPDPPGDGDGGGPGTPTIRITQIDLDRDANDYEPWYMGYAEVYFVFYEYDMLGWLLTIADMNPFGNVEEEDWNLAIGERTDWTKYEIWDGFNQVKPWRTINVETGWQSSDFDFNRNYKFRVIEYDPLFYDRGADYWCELFGMSIALTAGGTIPGWNLVAFAVGYYLGYLACSALVNNDDGIGDRNGFEDIVNTAINNSGTYYVWSTWAWKIKLVAD